MNKALSARHVDAIVACLSAIVLVASSFGDWYLVRVLHGGTTTMHANVDGHQSSMSLAFDAKPDFLRMAVSPWYADKPLAIGLVILALASVVAIVLGRIGTIDERLASVVFVLSALAAVGIFVVKLASATTASVGMMTVTWSPLAAFYVAAGAAAAMLVTSAAHLWRTTSSSISIASSPSS